MDFLFLPGKKVWSGSTSGPSQYFRGNFKGMVSTVRIFPEKLELIYFNLTFLSTTIYIVHSNLGLFFDLYFLLLDITKGSDGV